MKKIIIMGIPNHNNIGDAAIAEAEIDFIKKLFPANEIKLYSESKFEKVVINSKSEISDEDIIFIHGGGNIGNLYKWIEYGRRKVLELFPNNTIISFPETMYFEENEDGHKELEISKQIYNNHKHFILLTREPKTYEMCLKSFPKAHVFLTPDIVMTEKYSSNYSRENALLLLRYDPERAITDEITMNIKNTLNKYHKVLISSDTTSENGINNMDDNERKSVIFDKLKQCQQSKIVITDRLHGMIFSAITQTPCIALNNFNHKISGSYQKWFKDLNYIKVCDDIKDFDKLVSELNNIVPDSYDNDSKLNIIIDIMKKELAI